MYIGRNHNWDMILPFLMLAHNTAYQRTTGYSPFYLVYGRSPTFTIDASFFNTTSDNYTAIPELFVSPLEKCRQLARLRTEASQHDRKERYDSSHRDVSVRPGD